MQLRSVSGRGECAARGRTVQAEGVSDRLAPRGLEETPVTAIDKLICPSAASPANRAQRSRSACRASPLPSSRVHEALTAEELPSQSWGPTDAGLPANVGLDCQPEPAPRLL